VRRSDAGRQSRKLCGCVGIDVGKKFLTVCVLAGPAGSEASRRGGLAIRSERERTETITGMMEKKFTQAVMESTGLEAVFNILEGSLKMILAKPATCEGARGKKTDPNDRPVVSELPAAWLGARQLYSAMRHS